jgi:hypothetical protein
MIIVVLKFIYLFVCFWANQLSVINNIGFFPPPPLKGVPTSFKPMYNYHWQQWGFVFIICQGCHDFLQI